MKAFVVVDHVCEADIVVGVFSTSILAKKFMRIHRKDVYQNGWSLKYECLAIEDYEIDVLTD